MARMARIALLSAVVASGCSLPASLSPAMPKAVQTAAKPAGRATGLQVATGPAAPVAVRQACEQDQRRYLDHLMRVEQLQFPVMMPGTHTLQVTLDGAVLAYVVSCQGLAEKPDDEPEAKGGGKVGFASDFWYGPTGESLEMTGGFQVGVRGGGRLRTPASQARRGRTATMTFRTVDKPPAIAAALDTLYDRQLWSVQERFFPLRFTPFDSEATCTEWRQQGRLVAYVDSGLAGSKGGQGRYIGVQAWNLVGPDGTAIHGFARAIEPIGTTVFQRFAL